MSVTTFDQLPRVFALSGNEIFPMAQPQTAPIAPAVPWVTAGISAQAMQAYFQGTSTTGNVTMRQLKAALAAQSVMVETYAALPADITDSYNIAWVSANMMSLTDPFTTGFLQPTLGYTNGQMVALFELALTFPA